MEQTASDTSAFQDPNTDSSPKRRGRPKNLTGQPIKRNPNLTPEQKILLLQQIAVYKSNDEIIAWAKDKINFNLTPSLIHYHREAESSQSMLKKLREEFNANVLSVEWSSKRRRLEELGKIYVDCRAEGNHGQAIKALAQMQEEVEGKKSSGVTNMIQYNYNHLTDEEIDKKRLELLDSIKRHKILTISAQEPEVP